MSVSVKKSECISFRWKHSHVDLLCSAKDAMKVVRKRLQTNPSTNGWRSIGLTLTVGDDRTKFQERNSTDLVVLQLLEALTKNCGKVFHLQIAQKDFLKDFRAVLNPKNAPPTAIQEQVLGMIQVSEMNVDGRRRERRAIF